MKKGKPEHIHDLRVSLRRLSLLVRIGKPMLGKEPVGNFRQSATTLADSSGKLRDFDVGFEWLAEQKLPPQILKKLQSRRTRLWKTLRTKWKYFEPVLDKDKPSSKKLKKLLERYDKMLNRNELELYAYAANFTSLNEEEQHAFRRTVRRFRYLRELALTKKEQKHDPLLKKLVPLQESLGEYRNGLIARTMIKNLSLENQSKSLRKDLGTHLHAWEYAINKHMKNIELPDAERATMSKSSKTSK